MKNKKRNLFTLTVIFLLIFVTACNNQSSDQNQTAQIESKQTSPEKPIIENPEEVSERLGEIATSLPHVNAANVIVIGNTAIVGIDVESHLDRSRVGTIKYSVAEALRKDPYGAYAFVTADIDITERLKEITEEIRNGRPIAGFAEELADIIGRIIPQIPKDLTPQNNPPADANQEEQQKLDHKSQ